MRKLHSVSFMVLRKVGGTGLMLRKGLCYIFAFVILLTLAGCNNTSKEKTVYNKNDIAKSVSSQNIAENSQYTLFWNDDAKCVILQSKQSGKFWSTIPYEYLLNGGSSASVNSPINVRLSNNNNSTFEEVRGYSGAIEEGRVFSEKISNGISVTYCFDKYEISIPVIYTLQNEGLSISIDGKEIIESGNEWYLVSVSIAPYLCSASTKSKDSYLMVPSGSGALIYAAETSEKTRTFSGEIYGDDTSRYLQEKLTDDEAIRLPVFGVKDENEALLGIISEDSVAAELEAEAGNNRTGYSHIWPTFYFRGYDIVAPKVNAGTTGADDIIRVSEDISKNTAEVLFCPLTGEEANYIGMANSYRNYLLKNNFLEPSDENQEIYSMTFVGGLPIATSFVGIPYQKVCSLTTFGEAKQIISEIKEGTGKNPVVKLLGYGDNGIMPGKVAGGYKFNSVFGNSSSRMKLEEYCVNNDIKLFTDFDIVRYRSSGEGFGYRSNAAKTAIGKKAEGYELSAALHIFDEDFVYHLLSRKGLMSATERLISMLKEKDISGVSLDTLSSISYSDFSNSETYVKGNMAKDVRAILSKIHSAGHDISASAANSYAACVSDALFDVPTDNGNYYAFDEQIPFYQMVFRGAKPLYSEPINLSANPDKEIALAISSGIGLQFTLIKNYDAKYITVDKYNLHEMLYNGANEKINETVLQYSKIYDEIEDSYIVGYKNMSSGVSETIFSNGIKVYVNHTDAEAKCPAGVLKPYSAEFVN